MYYISLVLSYPQKQKENREKPFAHQKKTIAHWPHAEWGKYAKIKALPVYSGIGITPNNLSLIVPQTPIKNNSPSPSPRLSLKRWIWVPFALIFVLLIILAQIDLESIKEQLVQRASQETGLKVEMESIGFSFSHGFGFKGKDVKVSTPDGNRFSVDQLHLLAEWGPLLHGELKIKSIALEHPEATLTIPETPPEPSPVAEEKRQEKLPPPTEIIHPETLKSATEKLKSTQLSIEELMVTDGKITLIRSGSQKQILLKVDGTFVLNREKGGHQNISAKDIKVQTGSIVFEADGRAENLTTDNAGISFNLESNSFSWNELQPILQFLGDPATKMPLESVEVHQLLLSVKFPLNALSQIETLQEQMTGHIELKTTNAVLKIEDKHFSIESLQGEGNWENGLLIHKFSGTALESNFILNGKLPLFNLANDSTAHVEWTNLDFDKLPLPKEMAWTPTQGQVSGSLSFTGPLPKENETFPGKLKGTVEFQTAGLLLKSATPASPIEIGPLKGRGDFDQGVLQHEIHGTVWGSNFDIKGKLPLNQKNIVLDSKINWQALDVSKLPLPADAGWNPTEGTLSGTLTLAGPVVGDSFPGQLAGSIKFSAQNLKLQNPDSPPLFFNQLEGSGDIKNYLANYNVKGQTFRGTFHSDGTVKLSPSGPPTLNNRIEFANLDLSQFSPATSGKSGSVSGTLQLNGPLPDAKNILTGNLKIDTSFKVTDLKMEIDKLPLNIQQLEGKGTLNQGKLTHDMNGTLFGGKIATKGTLTFQQQKDQTLVTANSDLRLDKVNLNWVPLINKNEWAPSSGTVTGNLNINGPIPLDGNISPFLKLKGTLNAEKLVLGNSKGQIDVAKLNFKEGSATLTQAQVELERIKLADRGFKKMMGLFQITPEKIDLKGGQVWPMNGLINLTGDLQPESGSYRVKFKGENLKVEEFLQPHLIGPLEFSGALTGRLPKNIDAPKLPDYSRDLSGDIKLALNKGSLPELGVLKNLLILINPTSALEAGKTGLSYDYLGGDFKILKGVVHSDNLEMQSTQINLTAEGKANLVEDTVLAQVKAMPLQMLDKTIKAIPLLGQILAGGKKGGVIETYFKVEGKLSKPEFTMQPHKSLTEKPGSILNELMNLGK